ncbi:MAG: hypothetical protein M3O70_28960 [Actinomycetota bacterium]|nr:hypothetical protein [Actinomycetota bacterium]
MGPWDGWDLDRAVVAFTAVMYAGMWVQITLMHWAGGFKRPPMWVPVVATPLLVGAATAATVTRAGLFGWLVAGALAVGVVIGMVGVGFHLRGVSSQIGGLSFRNLLSGPPPVLPMAYALTGLLGVGGLVWHA